MLIPARRSHPGWGAQFVWPGQDRDGDDVKMSVDLARHRSIARRAARDMIHAAERELDEHTRVTDLATS
ncbi:hypothetical protein CKO28_00805 [Rhodovibrio sodomensis]|uniref:Uncharacterized protein n=2 Tax=Rhodovibrio sodomensis TaxID=1088 RepID=A0ABS1D9C7_9PROT|nr:hypothetical protein [Rhodovibrio sodomensis]